MAATRSAKTIENPAPLLTFRISSTGNKVMMENATAPELRSTPMKFITPE